MRPLADLLSRQPIVDAYTHMAGRAKLGTVWRALDLCALPTLAWEDGLEREARVVVFLHGSGERGVDGSSALRHGLPRVVEEGAEVSFKLVVPQCPVSSRWTDHLEDLRAVIDRLSSAVPCALTGFSMGGQGVWAFAATFPSRISRIAPVSGRLPVPAIALARAVRSIPTWVIHGTADERVPVTESDAIVAALRATGGKPAYSRYDATGHVPTCDRAYTDPELLDWLAR
jgi:predicted peptidase